MRIDHIKVNNWDVAKVVQEINKHTEGRNCHGVYFNKDSFLIGTLEIHTTPVQVHVETVEKPQPKVSKKSKYRGVCWDKGLQKWRVRIMVGGKRISLGVYDDELEAAKVYDAQALKSLGSCAKTNFKYKREIQYVFEGLEEKYSEVK